MIRSKSVGWDNKLALRVKLIESLCIMGLEQHLRSVDRSVCFDFLYNCF